jgi:hypothetical protein
MEYHDRMLRFAESLCAPHLLQLPRFSPCADRLILLAVGSVADGFCNERSDIDIAVVTDDVTYQEIATGTEWSQGKPSEATVDGMPVHFYGTTLSEIKERLAALEDFAIYSYLSARVLRDPHGEYAAMIDALDLDDMRARRTERSAADLTRRLTVFDKQPSSYDPLTLTALAAELTKLLVRTIALLDDVPFDPRKRPVLTGLSGQLGDELKPEILALFGTLAELEQPDAGPQWSLPVRLRAIVARLPLPAAQ